VSLGGFAAVEHPEDVKFANPFASPRATGPRQIAGNVQGASTDLELRSILTELRNETVFVDFGSSFCTHCRAMLPHFLMASRERPKQKFVVATVDYMLVEAEDIKWTPTVAVYKRGVKIDAFKLSDPQRLEDHLWLHTPDEEGR